MKNQTLRSLAISLAALGLLAGPAWSARVVQIRVGEHPTFTRVVFELDARAGYEIEQREVEGGHELVVTLSAASQPRKIGSRSPMVSAVEVEPSGTEAVATVRLRRSAPRVKELILASPPRIVLDLMLPEDLVRAAAAPKAKAKAKAKPEPATAKSATGATAKAPSAEPGPELPRVVADAPETRPKTPRSEASKPAPQATPPATKVPAVASKATRPPEVGASPAPVPRPTKPARTEDATERPKPIETAKAPESRPQPGSGAVAGEELEEPEPAPSKQAGPTSPPTSTPGMRVETALEGERVVVPKPGELEAAEDAPAKALPPVARPGETAPPKPAAKTPPPAAMPTTGKPGTSLFGLRLEGSNPWLTVALVGAGALIFLSVVVMLLRKHSRRTSLDALESSRLPTGVGDPFAAEASGDGARLGMQRASFPTAGPGLFDDESEKGDMDMAAQIPIDREPRGRMTPGPVGGDSDPGPLVRELERRLSQLESRLDQANEARERLERQVTAQSEELRVQRAAIARTQRALRGMTRGGEEATEPALRDPSKPPVGRP